MSHHHNTSSAVKPSERLYNRRLRQTHFVQAVDKLWKTAFASRPNLTYLCRAVAQSPAPQFYVSPKHALEQYNLWLSTGTVRTACPYTRQMYLDIFTRFQARYDRQGGIDFKYSVMQDILEQPAPSFYINPSAARAFYYRALAEKRKRNKSRKQL